MIGISGRYASGDLDDTLKMDLAAACMADCWTGE